MSENIPKKVLEFGENHGFGRLRYVGISDGKQVYGEVGEVDEDGFATPTGLPAFILWDGETAEDISGEDGLRLLSSFD